MRRKPHASWCRTLKELKGEITLSVWDKDEEDSSAALFSKKFWKDETDDFLGLITFKVDEIVQRGYEVRSTFVAAWPRPAERGGGWAHAGARAVVGMAVPSIMIDPALGSVVPPAETVQALSHQR